MSSHTGLAGNELADVGVELGQRPLCTRHSWLWVGYSIRKARLEFCLYDALWWTDQLGMPDPLTDREDAGPSTSCELNSA